MKMSRKYRRRATGLPTPPPLGPRYEDVPCHRAAHPCDGHLYCVGHGYSWPCSPPNTKKPGVPME
jgi:hypothetical protein